MKDEKTGSVPTPFFSVMQKATHIKLIQFELFQHVTITTG